MQPTATILKHAYIVTMDKAGNVYPDGALVMRGSRIDAVGATADILRRYEGQMLNEIDARGGLVMPGLIDGHSHPTNQLTNVGEGLRRTHLDAIEYLSRLAYPLERELPEELAKIGAKLCFAEMLRNGITCFSDGGGEKAHSIAAAAEEIGIRGTVCRSTRDYIPEGWPKDKIYCEDLATNVRESERLIEQWNGAADGRIRAWAGLRNPYTASDALVREIVTLAKRRGVGIHGHLASNFGDREFSRRLFGAGVVERYEALGVLGPNFYAGHMCELDDSEVATVVKHQVNIAHCPIVYVKGGYGVGTRIPELVDAGLNFAIGTDGSAASGSTDIFRVIFAFATIYNEDRHKRDVICPNAALEAATIGGAKANLWDGEIGSLEAGKRADVILVDRSGPEWRYVNRNIVQTIVYACNGEKVRSVWVDGAQVMKDRVLLTADTDALIAEAQAGVDALFRKVGLQPDAEDASNAGTRQR